MKLLALIIAIAAVPLRGLCLSVVWGWFMVPLGVNSIGAAHAIGLSTLISFFVDRPDKKSDDEKLWARVAAAVLTPLILLAIGWLCRAAM